MMKNKNFAVFILTHGRAKKQSTYNSIRKAGYTGKIYLIIDDEDKEKDIYIKEYGEQVIVFNKLKESETTDAGDNFLKRNSVIYARNASIDIAKTLGLDMYWELDDDYTNWFWTFDNEKNFLSKKPKIKSLDSILDIMIDFMMATNVDCIAFAQGGDFIGGPASGVAKLHKDGKFQRKVMNSFLFNTEKSMKFIGRMNDDVNTYVVNGKIGKIMFTLPRMMLNQEVTQKNTGGLTDMYKEFGTYVKSFYTVMMAPYCTKIRCMGKHQRLHHQINWNTAVPKIISEKHKK